MIRAFGNRVFRSFTNCADRSSPDKTNCSTLGKFCVLKFLSAKHLTTKEGVEFQYVPLYFFILSKRKFVFELVSIVLKMAVPPVGKAPKKSANEISKEKSAWLIKTVFSFT